MCFFVAIALGMFLLFKNIIIIRFAKMLRISGIAMRGKNINWGLRS
jgi:hypothetical protein